jgi:hypothetical protein
MVSDEIRFFHASDRRSVPVVHIDPAALEAAMHEIGLDVCQHRRIEAVPTRFFGRKAIRDTRLFFAEWDTGLRLCDVHLGEDNPRIMENFTGIVRGGEYMTLVPFS